MFMRFFSALTALLIVSSSSYAQNTKPDMIMYGAEIPGYMMNSDKRPGILIEMVTRAATIAGYHLTIKIVSWPRAMKLTSRGSNTMIPGLSRLPDREPNFTWIEPMVGAKSAFVSLRRQIDSFAEGRKLRLVGAWLGTSHEQELKEKKFDNISATGNIKQSIIMMERGRVGAWYGDINEIVSRWRENASDPYRKLYIGQALKVEKIWLAGGKNVSQRITRDFQIAIRKIIQSGLRDELIKKYFGYSPRK